MSIEVRETPQDTLAAARDWRDAAIVDGWTMEPTYKTYGADSFCTLKKDGWVAQIITFDDSAKRTEAQIRSGFSGIQSNVSVWAPDRLHVHVDRVYSMERLTASTRKCQLCGAVDVETTRYSFAGRCCLTCRKGPAKQYEVGNWTA